jgi:hypothetical protein
MNGLIVRLLGTEPPTIRVDLERPLRTRDAAPPAR